MPYIVEDSEEFWDDFRTVLSRKEKRDIKSKLLEFVEDIRQSEGLGILVEKYRLLEEETFSFRVRAEDHLFSVELSPRIFIFFYLKGRETPYYSLAHIRKIPRSGPL